MIVRTRNSPSTAGNASFKNVFNVFNLSNETLSLKSYRIGLLESAMSPERVTSRSGYAKNSEAITDDNRIVSKSPEVMSRDKPRFVHRGEMRLNILRYN